jgi:hypothetical protein
MRTHQGFHISCSRRLLVLSAAACVIVGAAFVPLLAQASRSGTGEVIAVRELELKAGVDIAEFERFARSTYNPGWEGVVPGLKAYIGKADRGALKGGYALILVFDGEKTRDAIFPKEGGGASPQFAPMLKGPFALNQELEKYLEPGALSVYTDYVAMR